MYMLVTLVVTETLAALVEHPNASPKKAWALNFLKAVELLDAGRIKGYDATRMKLLPNAVPSKWNTADAGPNISIAGRTPQGRNTTDENFKEDDWTLVQPKALDLVGTKYHLPTEDAQYKFLLTPSNTNDEVCNGGLSFVMALGSNGRALINSVREELRLGPLPPDYSVHFTLAKITDQEGHAAMRQWPIITNWPVIDGPTQLNKPLEDLSTEQGEEDSLKPGPPAYKSARTSSE